MKLSNSFVYIDFKNYDNKPINYNNKITETLEYSNNNDFILLDKISSINDKCENLLTYTDKNIVRIIPIDYNEFIQDIKQSYTKKDDILEQLAKDIPRMKLRINGNNINDVNNMNDYLSSKYNKEIVELISIISTQTVMAIPCEIVQRSIINYKHHYISELSNIDNYNKNLEINIQINDNDVNILIQKILRIAKVIEAECITKYILKTVIDIQLHKKLVFIKFSGKGL